MSLKSDVGLRIQECLNDVKNKKTVNEIILKMGRVLEKKRLLQNELPVIAFDNRIWIGNYSYASNKEFLEMNEIKIVVSCLQLPLSLYLPTLEYQRFQLKDGPDDRFEQTVFKFVEYIETHSGSIYVHCFSGRSRSVALLLGFIMHKSRKTYEEALEILRKVHPIASPNSYFQQILRKITFRYVENNNLLDGDYQAITYCPQKVKEVQIVEKVNNQSEINLLQIQQEAKPEKLSQNLLEEVTDIPALIQNSTLPVASQTSNEMNIFQTQILAPKQQISNNIEILDFNQQARQESYENERPIENIEYVQQEKLVIFQTKEEQIEQLTDKSEQMSTITQTTEETKIQTVNLLDEVPKTQIKTEKEESFADNTDFTQKKVKKNKKKR